MESTGNVDRDVRVLCWMNKCVQDYENRITEAKREAALGGFFHRRDAQKHLQRLERELREFKELCKISG